MILKTIIGTVIGIFNICIIAYFINPNLFRNIKITEHDTLIVIIIGVFVFLASAYNLFKIVRDNYNHKKKEKCQ